MSFTPVLKKFTVESRINAAGLNAHVIPFRGRKLEVVSSIDRDEDKQWEHVSVVVRGSSKCPDWDTMCFVKQLFWDSEDEVIQIHPKKSCYINLHNGCLHLWRLVGGFSWESKK